VRRFLGELEARSEATVVTDARLRRSGSGWDFDATLGSWTTL
jgi:hypothetical protein